MNREIGGYFEIEEQPMSDNEYYPDLVALNTARNALAYIIEARNIQKLFIPYYLCDAVSNLCKKEQCNFDYYHIDDLFLPVLEDDIGPNDYVYVVNYFGFLSNESIAKLKEQYKNIILDNVQAFFRKPMFDIDTVYSCRKFFGVPDGAYLYTNASIYRELPQDVSDNRLAHLLGRKNDTASAHYAEFKQSEESFYSLELKKMSLITKSIMRRIDYNRTINVRNENFRFLGQSLRYYNGLVIPDGVIGPYCYPFFCKNGAEIRKALIDNKIYVPLLWPNVVGLSEALDSLAYNILPLPCDQRYSSKDMAVISDIVIKYAG